MVLFFKICRFKNCKIELPSGTELTGHFSVSRVICGLPELFVKFLFSKKATKIDEMSNIDLTLCSKRLIVDEDFINFRGLLRKYEL